MAIRTVRVNAFVGRRVIRGSRISALYGIDQSSARRGMADVIKNYRKLVDHLSAQSPEVLLEALQPTFDKSQVYVPRDTGALAGSGYIEITSFRGRATVEIGYGAGGQPTYAVTVHENLEWRHKAPTRAKWLQVALEEDQEAIQGRIVAGYRRAGGFV